MNIAVVYVYPMVDMRRYYQLAKRFVSTYRQFTPKIEHSMWVVANGFDPSPHDQHVFDGVPVKWLVHDNQGWDIGAFQYAAEVVSCDLLVCMGANCHFHRHGWLERMADVYVENGPHFYGTRGFFYPPGHHIRTTCFWMHPELLKSYPRYVCSTHASRYDFEHGVGSMTNWVEQSGLKCLVATWDDVVGIERWHEGFGPVTTCLVYDQWTNAGPGKYDR